MKDEPGLYPACVALCVRDYNEVMASAKDADQVMGSERDMNQVMVNERGTNQVVESERDRDRRHGREGKWRWVGDGWVWRRVGGDEWWGVEGGVMGMGRGMGV